MRNYQLMRPFSLFQDLDKDFDQIFYPETKNAKWKPFSRVKEEETHYHLAMDIPGVDKEHLKVELNDQILTIAGERKDHFDKNGAEFDTYASFEQSYTLPKDSNFDEIEVNQSNGVLDIVIPKARKVDTKKSLEVKDGSSSFLTKLLK